jgi:hypothetical protein
MLPVASGTSSAPLSAQTAGKILTNAVFSVLKLAIPNLIAVGIVGLFL